jgi:hypothetical protein
MTRLGNGRGQSRSSLAEGEGSLRCIGRSKAADRSVRATRSSLLSSLSKGDQGGYWWDGTAAFLLKGVEVDAGLAGEGV